MKSTLAMALALAMGTSAMSATITPVPSKLNVSSGTLETFSLYSPQLERDVTIDVLLPEGYDKSMKYPVVYMHDGQNLFDASSVWNGQAWEMDEAVERLECTPPIIVGVYSTDATRVGDLMPAEPIAMLPSALVDAGMAALCPSGIRGDKYVDFIATTLKNEIDSHYSTASDVANTSVMGSSMGGLASFYAMCRHPEVFGNAACLSTHLTGLIEPNEIFPTVFAAYLLQNLPLDQNHRIYFDNGDQTIDANYTEYFHRLVAMLTQLGLDEEHFMWREFPGHAHDERSWASRVSIPLEFILRL